MKFDSNQYLNRVVRARFLAINLAHSSIRVASSVKYRNSSTFLSPFASPALPGFNARTGTLTPAGQVLRLLEHERLTTSQQVSLFISFDLPTIPSSTTLLPFPFRRFITLPQRERLPRLSPGQTLWSKGLPSRGLGFAIH